MTVTLETTRPDWEICCGVAQARTRRQEATANAGTIRRVIQGFQWLRETCPLDNRDVNRVAPCIDASPRPSSHDYRADVVPGLMSPLMICPPFITNSTCFMLAISSSKFPLRAMMSAMRPTSIAPMDRDGSTKSAALMVADRRTSNVDIPDAT